MGVGGTQEKIKEIQEQDKEFKEKELVLLGKFEDKIDEVLSNQKLILTKLEEQNLILSKLEKISKELK